MQTSSEHWIDTFSVIQVIENYVDLYTLSHNVLNLTLKALNYII